MRMKNKEIFMRNWIMAALVAVLAIGIIPAPRATAQEKAPMIGFLHKEADRYETEWRLHTGYYPTLAKNGLQGALVENQLLYQGTPAPGQLYAQLKGFHAIVLILDQEGVYRLNAEDQQRAKTVRADLERYVREGGGLFLQIEAERYPNAKDEEFNNLLLEPFGARTLHEGVYDKGHAFESPATVVFPAMPFFSTTNIKPHPTTQDVKRLYLPLYGTWPTPGVEALGLDESWQVVVAGEPSAKSYVAGTDNKIYLDKEGSQKTAPPIAAARDFGKGRVFIYSAPAKHTFLNYENRFWPQITESEGDKASGQSSGGNKLLVNALRWLAQPALALPDFGTHQLAPIEPIVFPKTVNWDADNYTFAKPDAGIRGILGAHSNYSDGKGTVADYVQAARTAGLSFIVFTDPLELLTKEKLGQLKADCAAASTADFYACPGVEFTDSLGVRWATWSDRVVWPESTFKDKGKDFPVWDGKKIVSTGRYEFLTGFSPNAIIDYGALRAANAHPANMWWFFNVFPFAYEGDKLIADNFNEYLQSLRDLRYLSVDAFTRIRSPQQVAAAAQTCVSSLDDLKAAREILNSRVTAAYKSAATNHYVTQGPRITQWDSINSNMDFPWQKTRGAQRIRLRFEVASDAGIAEVRVHDADRGLVRRYAGDGAKTLAREFEMTQDQQRYLVLEVVDTKGKRAVSAYQFLFSYKAGILRTTDNLNILGSSMLVWHPDRNQMPSLEKIFENGFMSTVQGIDRSGGVATQPSLFPLETISTTDGTFPANNEEIVNKILDMDVASHNLLIYSTDMKYRSEKFDTDTRPTPSMGAISRRLGPLEAFERHHTSYALKSRTDFFTTWNYRRPHEGLADYQGSVIWHEGEIRFKKDLTLKGSVPVPLLKTQGPGGAKFGIYDHFYATDRERGLIDVKLKPDQKDTLSQSGKVRPGGYVATLNTDLGYYAFLAPSGSDFSYSTSGNRNAPDLVGPTIIGLGEDGQQVKAGTVWKYRFAIATVADNAKDNKLLEQMVQTYNLDGDQNGYPHQVTTGKLEDAEFFFTVAATGNEAAFSLGPRATIADLPFRVRGVEDNGCAAVYVQGRDYFHFIPVWQGAAYFQEPIAPAEQMWVGNPFVCENKDVKLTLVVDGQAPGQPPLLEIHNPTDKALQTRVFSPPHTPRFGGMEATLNLPVGGSVFYRIEDKKLVEGKGLAATERNAQALTTQKAATPNLAENGDFETGIEGWSGQALDASLPSAERKTEAHPDFVAREQKDTAEKSRGALRVSLQGLEKIKAYSHSSGVICALTQKLEKGKNVRVSFWAKTLAGSPHLKISRPTGGGAANNVQLTPEWKQYTVALPLDFDTQTLIFSLVDSAVSRPIQSAANGEFLLDNVEVVVLEKSDGAIPG